MWTFIPANGHHVYVLEMQHGQEDRPPTFANRYCPLAMELDGKGNEMYEPDQLAFEEQSPTRIARSHSSPKKKKKVSKLLKPAPVCINAHNRTQAHLPRPTATLYTESIKCIKLNRFEQLIEKAITSLPKYQPCFEIDEQRPYKKPKSPLRFKLTHILHRFRSMCMKAHHVKNTRCSHMHMPRCSAFCFSTVASVDMNEAFQRALLEEEEAQADTLYHDENLPITHTQQPIAEVTTLQRTDSNNIDDEQDVVLDETIVFCRPYPPMPSPPAQEYIPTDPDSYQGDNDSTIDSAEYSSASPPDELQAITDLLDHCILPAPFSRYHNPSLTLLQN
jgi:hypothetical protein